MLRNRTKHIPHLTSNWLSPEHTNSNNKNGKYSSINWLLLLLEIHKLLEKLVPPVLWNAHVGLPLRCLGISTHTRTHTHTHMYNRKTRTPTCRQFDAQCIQIELILVCKIFRHLNSICMYAHLHIYTYTYVYSNVWACLCACIAVVLPYLPDACLDNCFLCKASVCQGVGPRNLSLSLVIYFPMLFYNLFKVKTELLERHMLVLLYSISKTFLWSLFLSHWSSASYLLT